MIPKGRTHEYLIWRSCERWGMLPPGVEKEWDKNNINTQASLLAYEQGRQKEEIECQGLK